MADAILNQTLDDATLFAAIFSTSRSAVVNQTLADVQLQAMAFQTNRASVVQSTADAQLSAFAISGQGDPDRPIQIPRIYNLTGRVRDSGGAILCFIGPPFRTVDWRMEQGHGTLTPYAKSTDALGRCSCRFDAVGFVERVIIGAAYVP